MLAVSEHFYSIQGEGPSIGAPAVFLRLRGCNLVCGGERTLHDGLLHDGATWRCDTIDIWTRGAPIALPVLHDVFRERGYLDAFERGAHLVVTGGEPLMQQEPLIRFLDYIAAAGSRPARIEVETNGSVVPLSELVERIDQFNVSPKLSNSGMLRSRRVREESMRALFDHPGSYLKLVVTDATDLDEAEATYIIPFAIPRARVLIMPGADDSASLARLMPLAVEWAKERGYRLSNRMHIQLWDKRTGV